jgi:hypothetical protein
MCPAIETAVDQSSDKSDIMSEHCMQLSPIKAIGMIGYSIKESLYCGITKLMLRSDTIIDVSQGESTAF